MGQATGGLLISAVICEEKQGRTGNPVSSWAQKTLEPSSTSSASITHRDTEGKFTEAYSTSKYTPSGLKLYITRENGDKPNICFHIQQAGVRRRFVHLGRCRNT